jgi:hypothetical protein
MNRKDFRPEGNKEEFSNKSYINPKHIGKVAYVRGDDSVGIPSWKGYVVDESETTVGVKDNKGHIEEVSLSQVKFQEDIDNENNYSHKAISLGKGTREYEITSHSRKDIHGKSTISVLADNESQIKRELNKNGMILDRIKVLR